MIAVQKYHNMCKAILFAQIASQVIVSVKQPKVLDQL